MCLSASPLRNVGESLTGCASRATSQQHSVTRLPKTTTLYGFQMPTPGRRADKDEEGRSLPLCFSRAIPAPALVEREHLFELTLSSPPTKNQADGADFDDSCLLFMLIMIIINQASCLRPVPAATALCVFATFQRQRKIHRRETKRI